MISSLFLQILKNRGKAKNRGFTLLEMVISTGLLGILMVSATGLLVSGLKAQQSSGAAYTVIQNIWFAHDLMARAIIFSPVKPFSETDENPQIDGTYTEIWIKDGGGEKIRYFLGSCGSGTSAICEKKGTVTVPLTAASVEVERLSFVLKGNAKQPMVTVIIGANSAVAPRQRLDLQTTGSMRAITFQ